MKLSTSFVLLGLSMSAARVYGWGAKGHETVGYDFYSFYIYDAVEGAWFCYRYIAMKGFLFFNSFIQTTDAHFFKFSFSLLKPLVSSKLLSVAPRIIRL